MKKVVIFGSTGSVGTSALDVIRKERNKFEIVGLCANRNIKVLEKQINEFKPKYVCVVDQEQGKRLKSSLKKGVRLFVGQDGLEDFASIKSDISLMAMSGISSLKPLLTNIKYTKRIALASKESLVVAGSLVFAHAKKYKTEIIPVDSEINALFQLFKKHKDISRIYLTASGGALFHYTKKDLVKVTVKEVLSHPTWKMGKRITVDSATLVNKGFEVIESKYFFDLPYENIDIVIHRESVVHGMVEFKDATVFACLYPPDMKVPISFALHYPERNFVSKGLDFGKSRSLTFEPMNYKDFPLCKMIIDAGKREDNSLVILNACDEVAVDFFLAGKIKFTDIYKVMGNIFRTYPRQRIKSVKDVFYWDDWARNKTGEYLNKLC